MSPPKGGKAPLETPPTTNLHEIRKGIVPTSARCIPSAQPEVITDSFREEMVAFLPRLLAFALSLTGNADQRDDLVQETCARALAHRDKFEPGTRLDSWMFRIAQNLWFDRKRAKKSRGELVDIESASNLSNSDGRTVAESKLALAEVLRGLDRLSPEHRVLIALVCVDGLTYKEASEVLDLPVGTVMSRLARARLALHEAINGTVASKATTTLETRRGRNPR